MSYDFSLTSMQRQATPEEQEKHGVDANWNKLTERAPMLSDAAIGKMSVTENGAAGENKYRMARRVRQFYEAKITSGELITREEHERLVKQAIKDHIQNEAEEE